MTQTASGFEDRLDRRKRGLAPKFANGKGQAYMDNLRNPETLPPHFFIEVVSIVIVAAIAILYFAGAIQ